MDLSADTARRFKTALPTGLLALYMFTFLLSELTVNARCAAVFGAECVTAIYSVGIACTSAGYLAFYFSRRFFKSDGGFSIALGALCYAALALAFTFGGGAVFLIGSFGALFSLGFLGGYAHFAVSLLVFEGGRAGRTVGAAVASATLAQFAVQRFFASGGALLAFMLAGAGGFLWLAFKAMGRTPLSSAVRGARKPSVKARDFALPCCIVAVMSVCFGLGDGIVTQLHASGAIDLVSGARLLYAAGVFLAGFAADFKKLKLLPLCTLCLLVLFSATALFLDETGSLASYIYVGVMYFFSGFYVMYLTVTFLNAAPLSACGELWAGMGRVVRGFFIGLTAYFSNSLFEAVGMRGIVLAGVCLSVLTLVLFVLDGGFELRAAERPAQASASEFSEKYRLTAREREVLEKLVGSDEGNKAIASELFISVRVLERYISSIYEKVGVQTRAGLLKVFYGY